jgi:hypothetical protein
MWVGALSLWLGFAAGVVAGAVTVALGGSPKRWGVAGSVFVIVTAGLLFGVFHSDVSEWLRRNERALGPLSVNCSVRAGTTVWTNGVSVDAGDEIEMQIRVENSADRQMDGVAVRLNAAPGMTLVPYTVMLKDSDFPNGVALAGDGSALLTGGYDLGSYGAGGTTYIYLRVRLDESLEPATTLRPVCVAAGRGGDEFYNSSNIEIRGE